MKTRKLLFLAAILALIVAVGFGCTKKQKGSTTTPDEAQQQEQAAQEQQEQQTKAMKEKALAQAKSTLTDDKVFFEFDKFDLKDQYRDILKKKAEILKKYPQVKVLIEGHCDERGTEEYNLALGERRARAAYDFLVLLGVNASQLEMVSYGEERPAVKGSNEAAWAQNRRCEFKIID